MTNSGSAQAAQSRGGSYDEGLLNGQRLLDQHPAVALQQAEMLLRAHPEPRAFELAAAALSRLGRAAEAEQAELSAITASFGIPELEDAAVAGQEGRSAEAEEVLEQFLLRRPANLLALTMAAELDIENWRLDRAEQRLATVLGRAPTFLRAIMLMAKCASSQARLNDAIDLFNAVLERKPDNQVALVNIAKSYSEANRHEKAAETYGRLLQLDPLNLDVTINHAQALRIIGRKDESIGAFRRALELDPNSGAAWWGLANFFPSAVTHADVQAMEEALERRSDSATDGGPLHVALGVLAERQGDYPEAFGHISAGKQLRTRIDDYDAAAESAAIDEQISQFTPDVFAGLAGAGCPDDAPIFIIGMPRSGTTLLERILSRHSKIEAGGELPIMPRLVEQLRHVGSGAPDATELTRMGDRYIRASRDYRVSDKPHFIDKMNSNWSRVGHVRMILPNARIIDLRRNALDCCWSNFKMMFAEGHKAANDQRDIARFYRDYVRLIDAVDSAAPGAILKVRYEELVDDIEGQTRRILGFLGLEFEPACLDFHLASEAVATPSSEQVRRPINRDSIGSAQPYREWLGPMIEELGDLADA